jgi:hypothetical protein
MIVAGFARSREKLLVLVSAAKPPKPAPTISFFWAATAANGRLFAGSIVAVALSSVSGQLQSPGLRSGNGKNG